ncbi:MULTISPECIES: hypothetical protein [unclassified Achromobacter]|uniref:hypothetical protein n=1 Tax=unclassified Achromobacter TaxID=2626865 RepID=UPI001177F539|nr:MULTISPECIES: hypothetical protein [unclassified Achromobacter]
MSTARTKERIAALEAGDAELTSLREENTMLFAQLHDVQEALERGHYLAAEQPASANSRFVMLDSRFPEVAAESLRYRKALEAREDLYRLQGRQSFASRFGTAMVHGVSGPGAALRLPGKLWSIWRDVKDYAPPRKLGGKGCQALISAYASGGDGAVQALLQRSPASVKASALTALARSLANNDVLGAANYARQAYELDPRPFRLKWLAFREHDAGRPELAEAMLEALPPEIQFSESEERQVEQLRADARQARGREIAQKYDPVSQSRVIEQKVRQLEHERAEQQALAARYMRQLDAAKLEQVAAERARAALALELARQGTQVLSLAEERDTLYRMHDELARKHDEAIAAHEALVGQHEDAVKAHRSLAGKHDALAVQHEALARKHADVLRTHDGVLRNHHDLVKRHENLLRQHDGVVQANDELTRAVQDRDRDVAHQRRQVEQLQWLRLQWERERLALLERETASKHEVEALSRLREEVQITVKDEVGNASRQLQALVGLLGYYNNGELPLVSPERNTWPVSPDFAVYLVQLLELKRYDVVIEFGSGLSTVVIAKALARQSAPRRTRAAVKADAIKTNAVKTKFISFEHQDVYHAQTLAQLQAAGVTGMVELLLAPLSPWANARKETYPYYDYGAVLKGLAASMRGRSLSVLVVVDGPPATVGKFARYPAGPIIRQLFPRAAIDFVLDDYIRDDEQEIATRWQTELQASGYTCQVTERQLEKGACLISARPRSEKT